MNDENPRFEINQKCPKCNTQFVAASDPTGRANRGPRMGEPGICNACGSVNVMAADGAFVEMTVNEFLHLPQHVGRGLRDMGIEVSRRLRAEAANNQA